MLGPKVSIAFILDHKLHHYRIPLFEKLGGHYDVTVFHRGPMVDGCFSFKQELLAYKEVGPFCWIEKVPDLNAFSSVVVMQNLRVLNIYLFPLKFRASDLLMWGIGTSSAKGVGSESAISFFARNVITSMYKGLALYSSMPLHNYWRINQRKACVVGNSIYNEFSFNSSRRVKKYFLFIGSLDKRKGIVELLYAFQAALRVNSGLQLKIVGAGPEKDSLEKKIHELELYDNVELLGAIYDGLQKSRVFEGAYCVISPLQAGLSVVESFSYGVPFVTSVNAITGGESQSVIHDENGVLFNDPSQLSDIILSFVDGRRCSSFLGNNAYMFFQKNLSFELYVKRFKSFIEKHND